VFHTADSTQQINSGYFGAVQILYLLKLCNVDLAAAAVFFFKEMLWRLTHVVAMWF